MKGATLTLIVERGTGESDEWAEEVDNNVDGVVTEKDLQERENGRGKGWEIGQRQKWEISE